MNSIGAVLLSKEVFYLLEYVLVPVPYFALNFCLVYQSSRSCPHSDPSHCVFPRWRADSFRVGPNNSKVPHSGRMLICQIADWTFSFKGTVVL